MADKFLKTLKLPGINEPYKIPQAAEDVGAVSKTLLWENAPSWYSTFAPQTIIINNLSDYEAVEIIFCDCEGSQCVLSTGMCPVGLSGAAANYGRMVSTGRNQMGERKFEITDTGIIFSEALVNGTEMNYEMVPRRIYGIKGVQ